MLGDKLKKVRHTCHHTQSDVAGLIHVSRQSVSKWENNKALPSLIILKMLSDYYKISIDNLMEDFFDDYTSK